MTTPQVDQLTQLASARPDSHAWSVEGEAITFGQLVRRVRILAGTFAAHNLGESSVIAFQLPNCVDALAIHLATRWLGAVSLPLSMAFRRRELQHVLSDAGVSLLVTADPAKYEEAAQLGAGIASEFGIPCVHAGKGLSNSLFELEGSAVESTEPVKTASDAPAVLLYTSGTTALPKGVLHSDRNLMFDAESILKIDDIRDGEVLFAPASVSHIAGVIFLLYLPFVRGNMACTLERWDALAAVTTIQKERCTWAAGATPFLQAILETIETQESTSMPLRVFRCGGADVAPALIRRARAVGIVAYRSYGCSEFPTVTGSAKDPEHRAAETDGRVHPHISIRIVDSVNQADVPYPSAGEILLKGPERLLRYTDTNATGGAIDNQGWFHTGDLGVLDHEGFLQIVGRIKDLIIRKGENVSAKEVEDVLATHDAVREVAVVGVPDEERGEMVCAFVAVRDRRQLDISEMRHHLKMVGIARYKWPERLEVLDKLPRNATGKVRKDQLRVSAANPTPNSKMAIGSHSTPDQERYVENERAWPLC